MALGCAKLVPSIWQIKVLVLEKSSLFIIQTSSLLKGNKNEKIIPSF